MRNRDRMLLLQVKDLKEIENEEKTVRQKRDSFRERRDTCMGEKHSQIHTILFSLHQYRSFISSKKNKNLYNLPL